MDNLQMVEKLRETANVTYEEARAVLQECNWDILDAMVQLEKQGKVSSGYTQANNNSNYSANSGQKTKGGETFGNMCGRFFRWLGVLVKKGNRNTFEVSKNGEVIMAFPVTAFALLLVFAFWVTVPILFLGLFFGWHYSFRGPELEREAVNNVFNKASQMADNIKKDVAHEVYKSSDDQTDDNNQTNDNN